MGNLRGFIIGIVVGAVVTAGLFLLMQHLIKAPNDKPEARRTGEPIEITRDPHKPDRPPVETERTPPQREPEPERTQTEKPTFERGGGDGEVFKQGEPYYEFKVPGRLTRSGEPVPIVRIRPIYPRRAAQEGLEGDVTVAFTITERGTVTDIRVVSSTNPVFERAAVRAVQNWRYKPKLVDGKPMAQQNVQVTIEFRLGEED